MKVHIELTEADLKRLVFAEIKRLSGDLNIAPTDIHIETRSKQNYKSEWEAGAGFRATLKKDIDE